VAQAHREWRRSLSSLAGSCLDGLLRAFYRALLLVGHLAVVSGRDGACERGVYGRLFEGQGPPHVPDPTPLISGLLNFYIAGKAVYPDGGLRGYLDGRRTLSGGKVFITGRPCKDGNEHHQHDEEKKLSHGIMEEAEKIAPGLQRYRLQRGGS